MPVLNTAHSFEALEQLPAFDARVPPWPAEVLVARACPLCRNDNDQCLVRPDGLPLSFCQPCGLWYASRIPDPQHLEAFYHRYFSSFRAQELDPLLALKLRRQADEPDIKVNRLEAVLGGFRNKRIAEVGCGLGLFLLRARRRGAEVIGNDLSVEACQFVRDNFAIDVVNAPLEECLEHVGSVDAVVMNDLIEHVVELETFLKSVNNLLKPGGAVLIWTPNGGAAGNCAEEGRKWLGFRVDLEHMQYLSPRTIGELARRFGWEIGHLETLGEPDLEGITRISSQNRSSEKGIRRLLRDMPALRRFVWTLREKFGRRAAKPSIDGLPGNYHLFAILRKV